MEVDDCPSRSRVRPAVCPLAPRPAAEISRFWGPKRPTSMDARSSYSIPLPLSPSGWQPGAEGAQLSMCGTVGCVPSAAAPGATAHATAANPGLPWRNSAESRARSPTDASGDRKRQLLPIWASAWGVGGEKSSSSSSSLPCPGPSVSSCLPASASACLTPSDSRSASYGALPRSCGLTAHGSGVVIPEQET